MPGAYLIFIFNLLFMKSHTVFSRFEELGYKPKHSKMAQAGKVIATLYKQMYQQQPPSTSVTVLGKAMSVNIYPESFGPQMDECIKQLLGMPGPAVVSTEKAASEDPTAKFGKRLRQR